MSANYRTKTVNPTTVPDTPSTPNYASKDPQTWNPTDVSDLLQANQEEGVLDEADIHLIRNNKIPGRLFLNLTREDLCGEPYKLADGTARAIVELIETLRKTGGRYFNSPH